MAMNFLYKKIIELIDANQEKFTTTTVCKNVIENFVARVVLLKESMIILKEAKCDFIEKNC